VTPSAKSEVNRDPDQTGAKNKTTAPADSHIIADYSTEGALPSLTLEIERDPVISRRYGRSCEAVAEMCL
jgi:hypothetical protein